MEQFCYALSLLVYFPTKQRNCSALDLIQEAFYDEENICTRWNEANFIPNLNVLLNISKDLLKDVYLVDVVDDNHESGVVYYIFEYQDTLYYVYRGSEASDELYHTTGWQDWSDNLKLFLDDVTPQQAYVQQSFLNHLPNQPFYLCGHSKGGNLAIYTAMSMDASLRKGLKGVVTFNAVGMQKALMDQYLPQISYDDLLKFYLFESEHDCVSSCFEHIKKPYIIKSPYPCRNMKDLYKHHNLYGIDCMLADDYLLTEDKSMIPQMIHYIVNDHFMHRNMESRKEFVEWMNTAFQQNLSSNELVLQALKHILKIQPSKIFHVNQDLSQLSWRQLSKRIQEFRKKGEQENEEVCDIESTSSNESA